ncbi:MAG TPA: hypothetical protein VF338_05600, partial [Leptolinea sp.]
MILAVALVYPGALIALDWIIRLPVNSSSAPVSLALQLASDSISKAPNRRMERAAILMNFEKIKSAKKNNLAVGHPRTPSQPPPKLKNTILGEE